MTNIEENNVSSNNKQHLIRKSIPLKDIYVEIPNVISVPVCIPEEVFFKVRPDRKVDVSVMEHEGVWYLISKTIMNQFADVIPVNVLHARLYHCLTEEGTYFILPAYMKHIKPDTKSDFYEISLHGTLEESIQEGSWVSLEYSEILKEYQFAGSGTNPLEDNTKWPKSGTFEETIAGAFQGDLYIDSNDHPLYEQLWTL